MKSERRRRRRNGVMPTVFSRLRRMTKNLNARATHTHTTFSNNKYTRRTQRTPKIFLHIEKYVHKKTTTTPFQQISIRKVCLGRENTNEILLAKMV